MKKIFIMIIISLCILFGFHKDVLAKPYYEGKVIKIMVGYEVGGGYDRMTRLLAKYLPAYIPGKPSIIVENRPGAQSMIAANYLYNIAKPDGLTIATIDRGLPFAQLLKMDGVQFDLRKFAWIGSTASEVMILALRTDLPYKTFEDLLKVKQPIPLASGGVGASDYQFPILLKEFAGLNIVIINYPSSAAEMLAVERKEVEGRAGSFSALQPYISRGLLRPFVRTRVYDPALEGLPVNEDLSINKTGKAIMGMLATADLIGRPYVAPPKTPAHLMTILKDAFSKVAKDQGLQADARKINMSINYTNSEEALKVINYVLNQPAEVVKEFGKYVKM